MNTTRPLLPDWDAHPDDGCEFSPSCFSCPLPACKHELPPHAPRALLAEERAAALLAEGLSVVEVAARMGITPRSVYRLRQQRWTRALPVLIGAGKA